MGPDGVLDVAVGLALAGVEDEDLVDLAVAVPVVVGEVDLGVGSLAHLDNHVLGTQVVAIVIVGTIVGVVVQGGVGAYDVERQFEQSVRLVAEVVGHAAAEALAGGVARLVQHVVVLLSVVFRLELHVGELAEDDQSALLSREGRRVEGTPSVPPRGEASVVKSGFRRPATPAAYTLAGRGGADGECRQQGEDGGQNLSFGHIL